jgi:hypothetical protein
MAKKCRHIWRPETTPPPPHLVAYPERAATAVASQKREVCAACGMTRVRR